MSLTTRSGTKATAAQLASMQAACSSCEMNLARAIKNATNIVRESGDPGRDATFAMQGQMEDAVAVIKGQVIKCLKIIEAIRINQDQTGANAKATEDLMDRVNDDANTALDHVFQQLARYEKALRPMPPSSGCSRGCPEGPYLQTGPRIEAGRINIRHVPSSVCLLVGLV
jgi:hypothetical protein